MCCALPPYYHYELLLLYNTLARLLNGTHKATKLLLVVVYFEVCNIHHTHTYHTNSLRRRCGAATTASSSWTHPVVESPPSTTCRCCQGARWRERRPLRGGDHTHHLLLHISEPPTNRTHHTCAKQNLTAKTASPSPWSPFFWKRINASRFSRPNRYFLLDVCNSIYFRASFIQQCKAGKAGR